MHAWAQYCEPPMAATKQLAAYMKLKATLRECPACDGKGQVPSRPPFRKKPCPESVTAMSRPRSASSC
jgi:hypothetical protein